MTQEALLRYAYKQAKTFHGEEEAVKYLLMELSNLEPHAFFMAMKQEVDPALEICYKEALKRYLEDHIPVQHLIGHSYFFGYKLKVNEHVLIPRAETEQLVEHVLYYIDTYFPHHDLHLLDLGTGSGCIGLTLAKEEPRCIVEASDISVDALEVAKINRKRLDVDVELTESNLFQNIHKRFDIIVSNPPYIPDQEIVEDIVQKEPSVALYGGTLGIDFYEKILVEAKHYLKEKALIAFEHGYQQKALLAHLARLYYPHSTIIQAKDLQGKDRFTFIGIGGVLENEQVSEK